MVEEKGRRDGDRRMEDVECFCILCDYLQKCNEDDHDVEILTSP